MTLSEQTADQPVRWGILSTANIGVKAVIPAIAASNNGRLAAIASRDLPRAEAVAARYPGMRAHGSYEALLADPNVEAVYISLPNALHAEWTIRAAAAGKHVLCEKPLGATPDEVRAMSEARRTAGVLLMEAFMYRFHPQIRWALEQIAAGAVGPVRLVRGAFAFDIRSSPGNIRLQAALAGGSLMDVGCYPLNFARAVYSASPLAVAARAVVPSGSEVERSVAAVLDFGGERLAVIDCSFEQPAQQFIEVAGDRGRLTIPRPFTPREQETIVRIERGDEAVERRFASTDQYRLQVEHFAACVRTGAPPFLPLADARAQAESIEAIYAAASYARPW